MKACIYIVSCCKYIFLQGQGDLVGPRPLLIFFNNKQYIISGVFVNLLDIEFKRWEYKGKSAVCGQNYQ